MAVVIVLEALPLLMATKSSFKNIFSTKMYCEQVQQIENKFLGSLEKVTRYEIKDKSLFLYKDKELLLEFAAAEEIKSTE